MEQRALSRKRPFLFFFFLPSSILYNSSYNTTMRTLILSDLHLGSRHCSMELLEEVLEKVAFERLILNGDTINNVNFRKLTHRHWAFLDKVRNLARSRELVLIRGNHDHEWDYLDARSEGGVRRTEEEEAASSALPPPPSILTTGCLLPAVLGVPMREDFRLEVQGKTYLVLHGDRFDPTLNWRFVTEVAFAAYQVTTKINKKLAKWLKKKSKRWGGILETVRAQAIAHARTANLSGIITGHTHFAEDLHIDDVHYINCGSWTEVPCAYVTADAQSLTLHHVSD